MRKVNLTKYARTYDNMTRFKPSYHEVHDTVVKDFKKYLPPTKRWNIGDFGGGTGELSLRLAPEYKKSTIFAAELNPGFLARLEEKLAEFDNTYAINANIEHPLFQPDSLDGAALIHVLNYTDHAKEGVVIGQIYEQLKPGGLFVTADIGRVLDMEAHKKETIGAAIGAIGYMRTAWMLANSLQVIKQNKRFVEGQKAGIHPTHTLDEFVRLVKFHGFEIISSRDDLYLGHDDYVVAKKPTE